MKHFWAKIISVACSRGCDDSVEVLHDEIGWSGPNFVFKSWGLKFNIFWSFYHQTVPLAIRSNYNWNNFEFYPKLFFVIGPNAFGPLFYLILGQTCSWSFFDQILDKLEDLWKQKFNKICFPLDKLVSNNQRKCFLAHIFHTKHIGSKQFEKDVPEPEMIS